MKRIPPPCPEPESGPTYWRSLDHLADTPEFRQWVEREFPDGASEFRDPVSRRHFLKIMSASFMLAGLGLAGTGCRRPEEHILPFTRQPEGYIHGMPEFYATAMPTRRSAVPLVVKAHESRPVKIEGNAEHPDSNGGTDTFSQASLLSLYDPDRAMRFTYQGTTTERARVMDFLDSSARKFTTNGGEGLCFLLEQSSSPSRERLLAAISKKFPQAQWFVYEPVNLDVGNSVASALAGQPVRSRHHLDRAKVILSLDCDFIGAEQDAHRFIRDFARGRKLTGPGDTMNRLYAVEGLLTQTGMNADHRLRVPTSTVVAIAAAIAAELVTGNAAIKALAQKHPLPAEVDRAWVTECAADLKANRGSSLILAGYRQPPAVHALAHWLNQMLGNSGKTVEFVPDLPTPGSIEQLAQLLDNGKVDTLVILGGNPVYNAPANLNWASAQAKAKSAVVRLGYFEDETFAASTWHLPMAHYLESWGDARTGDGTLVPVQPLIFPLFGGLTELEVLARIGGLQSYRPYQTVRDTFKELEGADNFEENWKKFLHDGFLANSAVKPVSVQFAPARLATLINNATATPAPDKDRVEVVFQRDYKVDDGRWSNNGWLQEMPDPVTKMTWDSAVLMSRKTAEAFGVQAAPTSGPHHGRAEMVEIELDGRKVKGPVWIQPGMADFVVGLALGYGRKKTERGGTGRVGHNVGAYNAYALRTSGAMHFTVGAKLRQAVETYQVACTQEHGAMEGRPIIREANAQQYAETPQFAKNMDPMAHTPFIPKDAEGRPIKIYEHPYHAYDDRKSQDGVDLSGKLFHSDVHQWGMSIDLNSCVGCTACVMACQSENNIPIVGKDQVWRSREMHWIRIDRYYSGDREKSHAEMIDDPQVVVQPMMCQHCEAAPCENVCPVNATVHDEEGLNVMVYNRCVGTRYCSNNCPYKVRRFNFFDYNSRTVRAVAGTVLSDAVDQRYGRRMGP